MIVLFENVRYELHYFKHTTQPSSCYFAEANLCAGNMFKVCNSHESDTREAEAWIFNASLYQGMQQFSLRPLPHTEAAALGQSVVHCQIAVTFP